MASFSLSRLKEEEGNNVSFFHWSGIIPSGVDTFENLQKRRFENLLCQEVSICEASTRMGGRPKKKKSKQQLNITTTYATEVLLEKHHQEAAETVPYWRDMVEVARWANHALQNDWCVHVMYRTTTHGIIVPLAYVILNCTNAERIEMKGVWKSLWGTLYSLKHSLSLQSSRTSVFDLLQWAMEQHDVQEGTTIYVMARIGLEKMLQKRAGIRLVYAGKKIPDNSRGQCVHAQFEWKRK